MEKNIAELSLWITREGMAQGWQQREKQNNTSKHAARVLDRNFNGVHLFPFSFIDPVRYGNARATRRKPAKEARVRSYAIKIFVVQQGKRCQVGFVDGNRCWQGVRRERSRRDIIKETRSTRRFFLVNFTNTYYYISYIQHHHY